VTVGPILKELNPAIEFDWLKPGRENRDERIICANLGLAIDDMVTAIKINEKSMENNI